MTTRTAADPPRLHRDRLTLTLYGSFVTWGWFLYSFNPSVPLLARELDVTHAQAGLHGTAMAVGAVGAAALTPRAIRRFGRRAVVAGAGVVIAAGTALLTTGTLLAVTLSAVVVLAVGGNMIISASLTGLADHHGRAASAAVTEANGVGSGLGLLGPLAVGACVAIGWGWRPAVAVTGVIALATAVLIRRLPVGGALGRGQAEQAAVVSGAPGTDAAGTGLAAAGGPGAGPVGAVAEGAAGSGPGGGPGRAVHASRWFLVTIVAAIAVENATTYWATDLVRERTGAGAGIATATTAGLVAGMTLIRFVVGPLSLRVSPARLLAAAFGVAVAGWAVLWTATSASVALAGLFLAGLGYGAHYPLGVALLLGASAGATDAAQARATVAGGLAIGIAPFLLGALADAVGTHAAFVVVPVVAVSGGVAALAGARAWRRERPAPAV
ncbi:sugar MFS transporter [Cellulomonas sp. C5510]|uniref:MFS transporter n=1 Tax=Cellulomonas sp. C5510 TaxID=2871170 RepID=UPI001C97CEB9|nr:MFS transporter [Cellulomonas sp. C5510]QZN84372.1 MFS transporter [Cellulomonas sp. C5510]